MSILEKKLKEFQKKPGNKTCFVCNQKVNCMYRGLFVGSPVLRYGFPHLGVHWMQWSPVEACLSPFTL